MAYDAFNKGDILNTGNGATVKVIKAYKMTWWKKALLFFGIKVRVHQLKLMPIPNAS